MKALSYKWDDEIWLLHVEGNNIGKDNKSVMYSRAIKNNGELENAITIKPGESYRFIISRKSAEETQVDFRFDSGLLVKIFRLKDRAYLPTSSDMFYSSRGPTN